MVGCWRCREEAAGYMPRTNWPDFLKELLSDIDGDMCVSCFSFYILYKKLDNIKASVLEIEEKLSNDE